MYKSFDESRQIELEHLPYSKDGKTLEQRIHSWMGEKNIMNLRFGLAGNSEKTQKEVADMLGISQSYISRLEKRIIMKLKREVAKMM